MEIFRIRINSNEFQKFLPVDPAVWQQDLLKLDCRSKLAHWKAPEIYVHNPKREEGDFFYLCPGALVANSSATDKLRDIFEMAGELLPITHEGSPFFLINVLECVNCLDPKDTQWVFGEKTGAKIRIQKYGFNSQRLSESTLFKIPETAVAEILCVEGLKDPEDEFKARIEASGLKGLIFEKIWSTDF